MSARQPAAGIRRVNRGRGHSYSIDGQTTVGVTTAIGVLDKPALVGWAANTTAGYAVDHWSELGNQPPSKRLDTLKRARYSDVDKASRRGTEVHKLAEELIHGRKIDVPDELAGHVESCVRFLDEWEPKPIITEAVVGHRKWRYCGTLDAVFQLPDGRIVIADWKTSRTGIYPETALQLAAYRFADCYVGPDGSEHPMDALGIGDVGLGVHIRGDGYDVIPLDVSETVFKDFTHVLWIHRMKTERMDGWRGEALPAPKVSAA